MSKMGKIMDCTIFVVNGPCTAGLGLAGEGVLSFSIAGPTGEGVTTPLTFCRQRRSAIVGGNEVHVRSCRGGMRWQMTSMTNDICHVLTAICHLSFGICHVSSAILRSSLTCSSAG